MKKLVDVKTLSEMISVKTKTIYEWVRKRLIPFYKLGHLVRFDVDEVLEWLENKKMPPLQQGV